MSERRTSQRIRRSRRSFFKGLGAAAFASPLVTGMLSRIALAQEGVYPQRFFLMFTGNGQHPDHWLPPSGGENDFVMAPVLEPLDPIRDKLLLISGFEDGKTHSVGMSGTTTGRPSTNGDGIATGGPSIDQFFADRWHGSTPLHSLELGVLPANAPNDQTIYSASGLPIPPIGTGIGAFERVFAVTNEDPAVALKRRAQKASVLDVIATDLEVLKTKLGSTSRRLLDEHLTLVREEEKDLQAPYEPTVCELHDKPSAGTGMVKTWNDHNATLTAAFRCGATRVAHLRAGGWGGIESGGYTEIGIDAGHHNAAHGGSSDPWNDLLGINKFHAEQLANLLVAMDAVEEGDGTMLDNTVVVWVNELGLGDFNHHSRTNLGIVFAGGKNLGMAQQAYRVVDGTKWGHALFSLTHLLGETDVASFGDMGDTLVPELWA